MTGESQETDFPRFESLERGERLAKRVAAMLSCSRREAELYIEGGWVRVEGVVVEEPQFRATPATRGCTWR